MREEFLTMAKIKVIIEIDEGEAQKDAGVDNLPDAIDVELGLFNYYGRGVAVERWDYIDRPSRFPTIQHSEDTLYDKCKLCPIKKKCQNDCFGETPCEFAKAFEQISFQLGLKDTCIQSLRAEQHKVTADNALNQRVFGAYVLTPALNAFNQNTSWWISKRGAALACYCFTASSVAEVEYQIKNALGQYINLLEQRLKSI